MKADTKEKTVVAARSGRSCYAGAACDAFLLSMVGVLWACLLDMMDSFADGLTDILFGEET